MTVRTPPPNILDKILNLLGRNRRIQIPEKAYQIYTKFGPFVQIKAKKECFLKALFRRKDTGND